MNDQNTNTCMTCSCPCEIHKEHNHPTQQAVQQQEHSMICSKCGLKAKTADKMQEHSCEIC